VLVDADYSQIELRILAHITGDEHMQQAFLNGEDIHRSTAAKIYNIRPEDVTPRLRSSAKAINFGIMYGKGAYSLSKDIGVSVAEAKAYMEAYFATFPGVRTYMDAIVERAREQDLLIVSANGFGCPGYARVSYCVDYDMIERSFSAFEKLYQSYR